MGEGGDEAGGRRAAAAGGAFLGVDLVAILLGGPLPAIDDPAARIADFYADSAGRLLAQAYVRGIAMALLVWFFALLAARLRTPATRVPAQLWVASAVVVAAVELVRVAIVAAVALQPERVPEGTIVVLHAFGLILGAAIAFPLAGAQVAGCLLLRRSDLPQWLVPTGAVLGAAWLVTGVRAVSTNHALWTAGTVVTFAWGLWLVAICVAVRPGTRRSPSP